jgi:hypothetical protein
MMLELLFFYNIEYKKMLGMQLTIITHGNHQLTTSNILTKTTLQHTNEHREEKMQHCEAC